jgi:hypothetical protein
VLTKFGGPDPARIKYVDFGDAEFTEHVTASGASYGHASAQGAEGVGAAFYAETPAFGVSPPLIELFSSAGGTPILFDEDGRRLASPENRQRVDVTAPDGTDTTFFGSFAGPGPFPNFFGTSAAAPHAAAVAALMLDARPGLSPARIYDGLERTATDMDDPSTPGFDRGFDQVSGFGLVRADAAVARLVDGGPIAGGRGDDRLGGTARAELIEGRGGDDALRGLAGRDALSGDEGDDRLEGGGGDVLAGGLGDDASTGGAGSDRFVVSPGSDTVADFARGGGDTIDLTSILLGAAQTGAELDDFLRFADLGGGRGTRLDVDVEGERDFAAADSTTTFEGVGLVVAGQSQARLIEHLPGRRGRSPHRLKGSPPAPARVLRNTKCLMCAGLSGSFRNPATKHPCSHVSPSAWV